MAGHSKWSSIKHAKAITDHRRGKLFTKLAREVIIAARQGGGDPDMNFRLRMAVQRAKDANMPNDNIDRAIKRGTGEAGDGAQLIEAVYEGYGPGGVAIMMETLSDNRNRTVSEVRTTLTARGRQPCGVRRRLVAVREARRDNRRGVRRRSGRSRAGRH